MKYQENQLMREQKPRIEKFLNYNFNHIKNVTLTDTRTNPTGVVHIEGYINDNKNLWIDASLDSQNGVEVVNVTDYIDEHYKKEEFKYKLKNVTEIEAEEKAKKKRIKFNHYA
ncbi:hypothetical protein MFLO_11025 [Listeria floridensis FSL S10-1187]|uniref:DUF1433 domain-containing protein n=1 Tax=Listeria floridensis FSL S10-1187 TaxID=1265817 RepID=A0ABN0RDY7_9LIST|nr:DUF1433 domain-containing protein [Listeria floridensis]EUJ29720.1 hypothetical protein MFLO_11025 [Listeria floridensis FSL S10-1187]